MVLNLNYKVFIPFLPNIIIKSFCRTYANANLKVTCPFTVMYRVSVIVSVSLQKFFNFIQVSKLGRSLKMIFFKSVGFTITRNTDHISKELIRIDCINTLVSVGTRQPLMYAIV